MNCQKGGCSCKQTQPNSTNFFFCPGPLATFCWPNLPIKIDIFSMDFGPNLEENYPRLQKLLVLVGSWTFNPTRLRFKAQAKQHQKGGGASNLWTRKVASPSLSLFFSSLIFSMVETDINRNIPKILQADWAEFFLRIISATGLNGAEGYPLCDCDFLHLSSLFSQAFSLPLFSLLIYTPSQPSKIH